MTKAGHTLSLHTCIMEKMFYFRYTVKQLL
jgi:hypothetical protein